MKRATILGVLVFFVFLGSIVLNTRIASAQPRLDNTASVMHKSDPTFPNFGRVVSEIVFFHATRIVINSDTKIITYYNDAGSVIGTENASEGFVRDIHYMQFFGSGVEDRVVPIECTGNRCDQ